MPHLNMPAGTYSEVSARWRERQSRNSGLEREMMNCKSSREVGKNRSAIIINGEEEASCRREGNARYVLSMGEPQSVGYVTERNQSSLLTCARPRTKNILD